MTWVPILSVSSLDFEGDLKILRKVLDSYQEKIQFENGYKFSSDAKLAMGWWFYEISVKITFFKNLVNMEHQLNSKIKDERDIVVLIQDQLKKRGSKARIKLISKPSLFTKYWTWLLK